MLCLVILSRVTTERIFCTKRKSTSRFLFGKLIATCCSLATARVVDITTRLGRNKRSIWSSTARRSKVNEKGHHSPRGGVYLYNNVTWLRLYNDEFWRYMYYKMLPRRMTPPLNGACEESIYIYIVLSLQF